MIADEVVAKAILRSLLMFTKRLWAKGLIIGALAAATISISTPIQAQALAEAPQQLTHRQQQLRRAVDEAYDAFKGDTKGKNADYIPYLAQVDSNLFGISVVTTDGEAYSVGDITYSFSIQSISKVFSLALAMDELGAEQVFSRIGSEPTGRAFNSVSAVVDMPTHTGNPLVNAGAIATVSLLRAKDADDRWNKILTFYGDAAGERLPLIEAVYKSEAATNQATGPWLPCF
jgi:glutaminase